MKSAFRSGQRRWQRWAMALYRLAIIGAAMACIAQRSEVVEQDLTEFQAIAQQHFPRVQSLGPVQDGWHPLLDERREIIGWVTSTSPQGERIVGYAGPAELLVMLDAARQVRAVRLLRSADTVGHVEKVKRDARFWSQWQGQDEGALGRLDAAVLVSGASLTSEAMTRAVAARFGAKNAGDFFPDELALSEVQAWFPQATELRATSRAGIIDVWQGSEKVGIVLRSARMGVTVRGFQGASDVLIALTTAQQVRGVSLRASRDNQPYWGDVQDELRYAQSFAGATVAEILGTSEHGAWILVSGASTTAHGLFLTVQEMLRRYQSPPPAAAAWPWSQVLGIIWLAGGVLVAFRGGKRTRIAFAMISVAAGLSLGWMLGQDQWINWARYSGREWPAWPMLTMTAIALLVPSFTGKNVYCAHLCPHGAAQSLVGQWSRRRWALPPRLHRSLVLVPWLTLVSIWALAWWGASLAFSAVEPFEVWSTGFVMLLPATIFTVGIIAAFFLPQAYCHYGCPTGALLKFLTHAPGRWTRRDGIALLLVVVTWGLEL